MTPLTRPALAVLAQQARNSAQPALSDVRVGILRRVAAGGVEKDRFVGEPPVAIARAADAAQRALADALLERELQPGVEQRRRLARTGRADDDVPRQIVEAVTAAPLLLERRDRLFEPLAQLRRFGARPVLARPPAGPPRPRAGRWRGRRAAAAGAADASQSDDDEGEQRRSARWRTRAAGSRRTRSRARRTR